MSEKTITYDCSCGLRVVVNAEWDQSVLRCPECVELLVTPPNPVIPDKVDNKANENVNMISVLRELKTKFEK